MRILRAAESSDRNSLHIRFRTSSRSGLLFLAAGNTDYLSVELSDGRLQARLDLGSGEQILQSENSTQVNDLAWHSLELLHDLYNVSMTLDQNTQTSTRMPRSDPELAIHDGFFVGGAGGLDKSYLPSDLPSFRGCLDEVIFNEHNLLSSLRPYSGLKTVYEVSLGCTPQFFASEEEPISFFSSRAYVSLPPWSQKQEWVFECLLHTSAQEGVVLYNSARHGDFVAMEIQEGLLVATVGRGGAKTELRSLTFINDRRWHYIKLDLTSRSLQLTVDKETVVSSIAARSRAFQLKGPLFVGGVDDSTRFEVRKMGLVSVSGKRIRGGSFKGCLSDIIVNQVKMGLTHAMVTKDISAGCEPEKEPVVASTAMPTSLIATHTPPIHMSTLPSGLVKKYGHNFLQLRNLVVPEGGRASLESKHIKVNLDFKKLGIRQSQIMFRIEEQPVHGQLRLDVDQDQEESTFSMLDLWHGRVMYVHGGSEDPQDFFMFSVFSSSRKEVPSYLKGKKMHRCNITVTPTNDAPELSLPQGNLFVLLENSKKPLTMEVLKATDIDSNRTDLVYSVLGNLNADAGFLENEDNPGHPITSFPHTALEEGKIVYVHTGVRNSRVVLRVSDGQKVSNTVVLRVMAIALEYKIINNTGVNVTQGETALIGTQQLSIQTNAVKQTLDIRYDVLDPPQFGMLQRLHSSGEWKDTKFFSQRLLEKERLRYVSTFQEVQDGNVRDQFRCKVTVAGTATEEVMVPIMVRWVGYDLLKNVRLDMDRARRVVVGSEHLYATAQGMSLEEDELHFRLLSPPQKGMLLLNSQELKVNSTFSQKDITDLHVEYQLVKRPHEDTSDVFKFHIFSKHSHSESHNFTFGIKADENHIFIKNEGLSLLEGGTKLITKVELFAETLSTKTMYYTINKSPKHGRLTRINTSNSTSDNGNIISFSNEDLLDERIIYIHDDSETTHDQFTFIASTFPGQKTSVMGDDIGSKQSFFNISIELVNDEKPIRVVDKVFHVVREGQKLLTLEDLRFQDADSDFSDGQLVYTRRGIPMGDLVMANDTSHRLHQFKQEDLEQKRVLFLHRGLSSGRFVLFVSDGKHYVSTLLDVSAHDPYIKVDNNTGILVQKGHLVSFGTANFSVVTNLDIREDRQVRFILREPAKHGQLLANSSGVESFTQNELKQGLLYYQHDNSNNMADSFGVRVTALGLVVDATVNVKVYLESHQRPPIVLRNKTILVEEGKPVKIEKSKLEVSHEDNLPSEIVFAVKRAPAHGYLRCFVEDEERYIGTEQSPIDSFTQEDINIGNIQYVQQEARQLNDSFTLQASNGVTEVNNIKMLVDIIPSLIPLKVFNFTVKEGASKALTEEIIRVTSQHFEGLNIQFSVSNGPQHGRIEHSLVLSIFHLQVEQEFIYYVHDDSETPADNFTVVANATGLRKRSLPNTVFVQVTPVNDEPPVITNNRVLRVWVGSVTEIGAEDLNAADLDTPPEQLEFIITQPSNGHLALKSAPTRPVMNFTQAHIQQGQLLFVHRGAMAGGFNFQVNDGMNFAPRQIFSVTARTLVLSLERNRPLKVFPGSSTAISVQDLLAVTNDNSGKSNRTIVYTMVSPPRLGRLITPQLDNSSREVSTFTQAMVDQGVVYYEHTRVDSVGWASLDSWSFSVSAPPALLEDQTFNIDISYENSGPGRNTVLLKNTGTFTCGKVKIDKSMLDATNLLTKQPESQRDSYEVWYQVRSLPEHGFIVVGERNLTKEKPNFSQFILNKYGITYQHDNSETASDRFGFDVFLNLKSKPPQRPQEDAEVLQESFNITILPVNDQPPVLKTKAPSLRVVQGDTVLLGPDSLTVEDLDNRPEEILYTVITQPSNGFLALDGSRIEPVLTFTQAQINSAQLYFIQDGTPASGVFYFSVSDGHHRPVYKLFNLEVTPIVIMLANNTLVLLEQGETSVTLSNVHLAAETNGKNSTVHFHITRPAQHGKLLVDNKEVTTFCQEHLQQQRLSYHMTSLASSSDSFEFTAFTSEVNLTDQLLSISVKPRIHVQPGVQVPNGVSFKLTPRFLNATDLAVLSGSDPVFEISAQPKYGKVTRASRNTRQMNSADSFTFHDIEQEKIHLEVKANLTGILELNDSLGFVLKAKNVPPARGEFAFIIVPYDPGLMVTIGPTTITRYLTSSMTTSAGISPFTHISSTQQAAKILPKSRSRNRWGNQNRTDAAIPATPQPSEERADVAPVKNTAGNVEPQLEASSTPLMVVLPLLALILLVLVLGLLVLFMRRQKRKQLKPPPQHHATQPPSPGVTACQSQAEWSAAVHTVKVTALSPNSPSLDRFHMGPSSMSLCSWVGLEEEAGKLCRTTTPTLQRSQYWV
uniref:Laminin G domain-containing protein n=1 Tax=Denticeps clupeoides TaxID=299321 RepID=A0AAY4BN87_9TELE